MHEKMIAMTMSRIVRAEDADVDESRRGLRFAFAATKMRKNLLGARPVRRC